MVRVHGTQKALAISTDVTPRYCFADPVEGGKQAVAETYRNITTTGATPLAITNCLNFGNPEKPEIMGQIVGALQGMKAACEALDYPVISGNVSLYNETKGEGIFPTPAIGGVGLLQDVSQRIGNQITAEGLTLLLIGETKGHLGASLYLREIEGREEGAPPPVDLTAERKYGDFVREQILAGHINACHDVSDGGLLVALAEMCMPQEIGATLDFPAENPVAFAFGEDQGRYILAVEDSKVEAVRQAAKAQNIPCSTLGVSAGEHLIAEGYVNLPIATLKQANESALPDYMAV